MKTDQPPTWEKTLRRYILGPGLALIVMVVLILSTTGIDPRKWKDADSKSFQTSPEGEDWQPYTAGRLRYFQEAGEPVLVHLVASFSPAASESRVLFGTSQTLQTLLEKHRVRKLLADLSGASTESQQLLDALGESQTPVVAVYLPGVEEPAVRAGIVDEAWLRGVLTSTHQP